MDKLSELLKRPTERGYIDLSHIPQKPTVCTHDCPICGGIGLVRLDVVDIFDPHFGKMEPCPNVPGEKLYGGSSGLAKDEFNLSWNNIIDRENVMLAVKAVQECLESGYGWVYLWGGVGLAKTMIGRIAVAETIRTRKPAATVRMAELLGNLREAFDTDNPSQESTRRLDRWADIPVLFIDEFDRVKDTEYVSEKRFVLMDRRYEMALRGESITIMASNADPAVFLIDPKTKDGYLKDRVFDRRFSVVKLTGASMRPMMGRQ
jgi:DNA replication protein DnaC